MPICYVSAYQNTFRRTSACLDRLCCCLPHSPAPVFMPMKPSLPHLFKELGLRGRYHRRGKDGRCPPGSTLMPAGLDGHRSSGMSHAVLPFQGESSTTSHTPHLGDSQAFLVAKQESERSAPVGRREKI